jgi:hypothetical protein
MVPTGLVIDGRRPTGTNLVGFPHGLYGKERPNLRKLLPQVAARLTGKHVRLRFPKSKRENLASGGIGEQRGTLEPPMLLGRWDNGVVIELDYVL